MQIDNKLSIQSPRDAGEVMNSNDLQKRKVDQSGVDKIERVCTSYCLYIYESDRY